MPVGLLGEHRNVTDGRRLAQHTAHLVEVEGEVGGPLALDHRGPGDAGDVGVQGVGGLERGDVPARAAVGEQQRLQHLVGAVGGEDLLGPHAVEGGDPGPQLAVGPVGVAVPLGRDTSAASASRQAAAAGRRLVGVEAHGHVDLRRVVAPSGSQVVA
jgi:hypothetical protein